ncbi:MAG: SARP family transcriptional regulator, partial [Actinomycetota bacterium]|nr:SARP family transcriptional regulator [Actinomycetota bacterium]
MIELSLLGGFVFSVGGEAVVGISQGSQRLIVFLALSDRLVTRHEVARALWPGSSTVHGSDSLRSAVSRLDSRISETVRVTAVGLGLAESVIVDFRHALSVARWMVDRDTPQDGTDIGTAAVSALSKDLLPGWYDEWVIVAAEDWHQRRLHALE